MRRHRDPKSRTSLYLILVAAGLFLIGATLLPILLAEQGAALDGSGIIRPPVIMNQTAPHLALTDLQANPVSLDDYHGKVVLVNNWATWCPPCQAEMPELQAYYLAHLRQGFVIVAIESGEPAATVADFVQQYGLTFPVWLDQDGESLDAFSNMSLPSSYVLDQQGTLRMSWTGSVSQAILEKYVTPLLEK
jgi:cytochrome c biogenesis protein CcmG, thiol:disulfide interchange protein DsbE